MGILGPLELDVEQSLCGGVEGFESPTALRLRERRSEHDAERLAVPISACGGTAQACSNLQPAPLAQPWECHQSQQ